MRDNDSPLEIAWRGRWIVLAVFAVFVVTTYAVSKSLPKVYEASSTLLIVQGEDQQTFDAVQSAQVLARTYGDLIESDNVADQVARRLGGTEDGSDIESDMSFEPVAETQLLRITAESEDPARAQRLANTYAQVFTDYVRRRLVRATQANLEIADVAAVPEDPVRPRPALYTLVGGLLGLLTGLAVVFARDRLRWRVRFLDDIAERLGVPVVARVPQLRRGSFASLAGREPFRLLRTNVQVPSGGRAPRLLAVTSARHGEGRTTVAVNLGVVLAESGARVLLVQADATAMRDSATSSALRPQQKPEVGGLRQYLLGNVALEDAIRSTAYPGVEVLPLDGAAGPPPDVVPRGLAWLLETRTGRDLMAALRERADVVLIDCPPMHENADAAVIAGRADGVLLVIDARNVDEQAVSEAVRQLKVVEANLRGVVLNRVPAMKEARRPPARPAAPPPPAVIRPADQPPVSARRRAE